MNRPRGVQINEAIVLVAGAAFLMVMVAPDEDRFYWTPLVLGLSLLAAGVVAGRTSGHWAPATVLVGWGAAVIFVRLVEPDLDTSGLYLAGAAAGALAGLELARHSFAVDPVTVAAVAMLAGAVLALTPQAGVLTDARTYAALLGLLALAQLLKAVRHKKHP